MSTPFLMPVDDYRRDIDIPKGYIQQVAKYLQLQLEKPYDECVQFVLKNIRKDGAFPMRDPVMTRLNKKRPGERVLEEVTFLSHLEDAISSGRILSPSMVIYERPEVEKSPISEWQEDNIAARKASKKEMLRLKNIGDLVQSALKDYDQNARKIRINSVSGMHGSPANPLYMASGHSSLTSLCRAAAGYGNATVERFLAGSRHFHTPDIAKANLLAMLTIEKSQRFLPIIERYNLVYPSVEDTLGMVIRGGEEYWDVTNDALISPIRSMIQGMTDVERAICCYSGDMYHLAKLNPGIVRDILTDLIALDLSDVGEVDPDAELSSLDATDRAYVNSICTDIVKGKDIRDIKTNEPENYLILGKTAKKVKMMLEKYADIIGVLFVPHHLPPTVANLKNVQRRVCLAADTDSSIFTCEHWVQWYCGHLKRGNIEDRIWYLATYMVCQCIAHALAMLSANVGVERAMMFRLAMKNEFGFAEFALTNLAKHYFTTKTVQEGNVYAKMEMEIKGVELRGSTSQKHILQRTEDLMTFILHEIDAGRKLNAGKILRDIAECELETIRSIQKGEYTYLRSANVKPDSKNMVYHDLWQEVFAPKYGRTVEPPYPCVKVTTDLVNKTALKEWLLAIEDKDLAKRMGQWLDRYNRKDLKTILLPTQAIRSSGLPIEIQDAANTRKLAYQINSGFYRILESTGLYLVDRNNYRLIFDFLGLKP